MNETLLKITCAACVVALVVCGASILGKALPLSNRYDNAARYTAGGTELTAAVKNLDIHWTDGEVNLAYHPQATVEISETAPKAIPADAALRWWLDGDTLRIQYAKSGYRSLSGLEKALTVTLPEGIELERVAVDLTSGNVSAPDLRADDIRVDMTSGDLALRQSGASKRVALSSTSGDIRAEIPEVERMEISVTSGSIQAILGSADEVSVSTTSGRILLEGDASRKTRIETTSGMIDVALASFSDLRIDATSGDITAALPPEPGYRAEIDTTSGSVDFALPLSREGKSYTCGDGSASLKIDATSGSVRLKAFNDDR